VFVVALIVGSCLWIGLRNPTCVESLRACTRARTFIYVLYDIIMLHITRALRITKFSCGRNH